MTHLKCKVNPENINIWVVDLLMYVYVICLPQGCKWRLSQVQGKATGVWYQYQKNIRELGLQWADEKPSMYVIIHWIK